jgi:AcrR family transcriptional regulator
MSEIARRRAAAAASADTNPAYREKQDLIRKAAGRVFHQRGFHAATLNDVAGEAGVDRASLYYYVGSKEQLFRDVVSEAVTANIETAEAIAAESGSAADKLTRVIRGLMTSFEQNYPYMYVFVQEDFAKLGEGTGQDSEWVAAVQGWNSRYFGIVRGIIKAGIDTGEFSSPLPAGILTHCVIGMMNYSNVWFRPQELLDADEIAKGMSHLILTGLNAR